MKWQCIALALAAAVLTSATLRAQQSDSTKPHRTHKPKTASTDSVSGSVAPKKPHSKKPSSPPGHGAAAKGEKTTTDSSRMPPHMHDSTTGSP